MTRLMTVKMVRAKHWDEMQAASLNQERAIQAARTAHLTPMGIADQTMSETMMEVLRTSTTAARVQREAQDSLGTARANRMWSSAVRKSQARSLI